MIKCQSCGSPNLYGSQYCDECGTRLLKNNESAIDKSNHSPEFRTQIAESPVFQSSSATSVGIPSIAEVIKEAEKSLGEGKKLKAKGVHSTLKIERGESSGAEFSLAAEESYIGRWDADNGVFPDVDLDAHDPEAKVSRRHARITFADGKYSIEDLGSTNGTFVNRGRRLIPGTPQPLGEGDEIIVGKTFMRFYVNQ